MILSDKIIASYVEGFSGIYIYCSQDSVGEIADKFTELFEVAWNQAMDDAEKEYNAVCQEKEDGIAIPATVNKREGWEKANRLYIEIQPLYLSMNYGARADNEYGTKALEDTLKRIKELYPNIKYEGLIAYEYSDQHSGDVINYEITSYDIAINNDKTYDFIRDKLNMVLSDEDYAEDFWDKMSYQLDGAYEEDLSEIIKDFQTYSVEQEHIDKLMELAEEYGLDLNSED